jgi:hypothetical protein
MEENNNYEKILDEINNLLQMLESYKGAPLDDRRLPPDLLTRMAKLDQDTKKIEALNQVILEQNKAITTTIKSLVPDFEPELPSSVKRVIQRSNELAMKLKSLESEMMGKSKSHIQTGHPPEPVKTQKELDKGSGKKRKGKFRHMDGDIGRKPL